MQNQKNKLSLLLIVLAYAGFISIGLPDGLLGVAWPSVRAAFGLPLDALGGLLVLYTLGYLVASFSSGRLLAHLSLGLLLALSCLATGLSLLGYAAAGHWWQMLLAAALAGLGAGAIDAGLNTYAALHFSARMVNWLHACYGIGALSGPMLMSSVLAAAQPWQWGYALVGAAQLALAAGFAVTQRRWDSEHAASTTTQTESQTVASTLRQPVVWLSVATFFVYTGIEAAAGAWAYSLFTEARALPAMTAGTWVSVYWSALTAGRVLAALLTGAMPVQWLLRVCIIGQAGGAALVWCDFGNLSSLLGLALLGLACAPIFPALITTTPERIGRNHLANAVGFQIAAAVLGQSLLPALCGVLAQRLGLEAVMPAVLVAALLLLGLFETLLAVGRGLKRAASVAT